MDTLMNDALAEKALRKIEQHEELWDQSNWVKHDPYCGTTMCFGGWALIESGEWKMKVVDHDGDIPIYDFVNVNTGVSVDDHRAGGALYEVMHLLGVERDTDQWHRLCDVMLRWNSLMGSDEEFTAKEFAAVVREHLGMPTPA